jgi:hypothetical protein
MIEEQFFDFYCPRCQSRVQAKVDGWSYDGDENLPDKYSLGRCVSCNQPALVVQSRSAAFLDVEVWEPGQQIFPRTIRSIEYKLPSKVEQAYKEALKCESAEAWLALAVMVRRTLEAIGREFDSNVRSPSTGLRAMKDKGVISEELWHWGEELRFLGNIGAHPSDEVVSAEDGKDALEFLEAIIETIYHLRPKFQMMKERRAKSTQPGKGEAA